MPVPKFPNISQLRRWKVRIGHGLDVVASYDDHLEYPWFLEINKNALEDLGVRNGAPRSGWLEAPLALALCSIGPRVLQNRHTDKDNKLAKTDNLVLRTGRQNVWMIIGHFNTDRVRYAFTAHADMFHLGWAGNALDQMDGVLHNWELIIEHIPEPVMPMEQPRYVCFEQYAHSRVLKENVWAYNRARIRGDNACASLEFPKSTMDMYISDSTHQAHLNELCDSFPKGVASELSLGVSVLAATKGKEGRI